MNNNSIRTQKEFIELLEKLTSEGKVYKIDKLSNRILEVVDDKLVDKEAEAIYTQFCKDYNILLNSKLFFTLFRGYLYNTSSEEDLDNFIKDDLFYSIFEFTENKKEVTMNDICLHLFNLSSNKVKQELRTHVARCLTHMKFTTKRTAKGIKWITSKELAQPTQSSTTLATTESKQSQTAYTRAYIEDTQPTQAKSYKEEFELFKELYYKEKTKVEERDKRIADLESQLEEFKNKATPVREVAISGKIPLDDDF